MVYFYEYFTSFTMEDDKLVLIANTKNLGSAFD